MKGFRDTTKTISGHNFAKSGHTFQAYFPQKRPAPGRGAGPGRVEGLTDHGNPNDSGMAGHAGINRQVPSTVNDEEHGGKSPLNPGYAKGGGFHVHKHYHMGGKVKTVSKSYGGFGGSMQGSKKVGAKTRNGGFPSGSTGASRPKLKKGGWATGGTRNCMATGGTRNPVKKGGGMHIKPGNKGKFTKKMTGSKSGHLTGSDVQRGLHSSSPETRKEANFARMARRGFKKLARGGSAGHTHHISCETGPEHEFARGGHIHDNTEVIAPNYGAGGALYALGGKVR